jgi:glycosyltransferase involved in cell wall biosynthesis
MTQSIQPFISIVVPTYEMKGQGVVFLERCLTSITKQIDIDQNTIEIVVSDQSSNVAIEQYCRGHKLSIQYHRVNTGKGIAAHNLNAGIAKASGKYIKILFQDDLLVEDSYLEKMVMKICNDQPDVILSAATHTNNGIDLYNPLVPQDNLYFLFGNNTISSPSVLTIKAEIAKANCFDERLLMLFDCDFYYRIFNQNLKIEILESIHIANGVWEGQAQHHIDPQQFTKEVRYLNWKHPLAQMTSLLPAYEQLFHSLHPNAELPFSKDLKLSWLNKLAYQFLTKPQKDLRH